MTNGVFDLHKERDIVANIVLDAIDDGPLDDTPAFTVPDAHYFMLGDHRDHSEDSRAMDKIGFIPQENILGKVDSAYWNGCLKKFTFKPMVYDWEDEE